MPKSIFIFVFFFCFNIALNQGQLIRVYTCSDMTSSVCTISNVYLDTNESSFLPSSRYPASVKELTIESSEIPFVQSNICDAFKNLEYIKLNFISIRNVSEDAFNSCESLKYLYLSSNRIEILLPNTFNQNFGLQTIDLSFNQIEYLPTDLFKNLAKLSILDLTQNMLVDISNVNFNDVEFLSHFYLRHNPLEDFNVEILPETLLDVVYLQDTDIRCERLEMIFKVSQERVFTISEATMGDYRTREYDPPTQNFIKCLTNQQYQKEKLFKTLPKLLDDIQEKLDTVSNATVVDHYQRLLAIETMLNEERDRHQAEVKALKEELVQVNLKFDEIERKFENLRKNMTEGSCGQKSFAELEQTIEFQLKKMLDFMKLQDMANKITFNDIPKEEK